ncbi:hypothetical protein PG989_013658 [Apiospora arundinis]
MVALALAAHPKLFVTIALWLVALLAPSIVLLALKIGVGRSDTLYIDAFELARIPMAVRHEFFTINTCRGGLLGRVCGRAVLVAHGLLVEGALVRIEVLDAAVVPLARAVPVRVREGVDIRGADEARVLLLGAVHVAAHPVPVVVVAPGLPLAEAVLRARGVARVGAAVHGKAIEALVARRRVRAALGARVSGHGRGRSRRRCCGRPPRRHRHGGGRRGAAVADAAERRAAVAPPVGERVGVAVRVAVEALVGLLAAVEGRALAVVGVTGAPGVPLAHAEGVSDVEAGVQGPGTRDWEVDKEDDGEDGDEEDSVDNVLVKAEDTLVMLDTLVDEDLSVLLLRLDDDVLDDEEVPDTVDPVCDELVDAKLNEAGLVTLRDVPTDSEELWLLVKLVVKLRVRYRFRRPVCARIWQMLLPSLWQQQQDPTGQRGKAASRGSEL